VDVHFGVVKWKDGSVVNQELWRFGTHGRCVFPEMGGHVLGRDLWIGTVEVQKLSVRLAGR
jgi:hypothetical protein